MLRACAAIAWPSAIDRIRLSASRRVVSLAATEVGGKMFIAA